LYYGGRFRPKIETKAKRHAPKDKEQSMNNQPPLPPQSQSGLRLCQRNPALLRHEKNRFVAGDAGHRITTKINSTKE
jgi:hypothetical protein